MKLAGRSLNTCQCSLRGVQYHSFNSFQPMKLQEKTLMLVQSSVHRFKPTQHVTSSPTCMLLCYCWRNTEQSIIKHTLPNWGTVHIWSPERLSAAQKEWWLEHPQPLYFFIPTRQWAACWWDASLDLVRYHKSLVVNNIYEEIKGSLTMTAWFLLFLFLLFRVIETQASAATH